MEKFTNRNIQNNELEQVEFSLQDRIWHIHNLEKKTPPETKKLL